MDLKNYCSYFSLTTWRTSFGDTLVLITQHLFIWGLEHVGRWKQTKTPGGGEAPGQREQPLARMLLLAHMAPRPALGIIH